MKMSLEMFVEKLNFEKTGDYLRGRREPLKRYFCTRFINRFS